MDPSGRACFFQYDDHDRPTNYSLYRHALIPNMTSIRSLDIDQIDFCGVDALSTASKLSTCSYTISRKFHPSYHSLYILYSNIRCGAEISRRNTNRAVLTRLYKESCLPDFSISICTYMTCLTLSITYTFTNSRRTCKQQGWASYTSTSATWRSDHSEVHRRYAAGRLSKSNAPLCDDSDSMHSSLLGRCAHAV